MESGDAQTFKGKEYKESHGEIWEKAKGAGVIKERRFRVWS